MSAKAYTEPHRVVYYEADDTGHLTVAMLINLFVLVSDDQSNDLGLPTDFIQSFGVGWVVTQYHVQITRLPRTGETVTLKTRATAYNRYFAYREYWLLDANGETLAYGEGIWVTMSYANRKITTIPAAIMAPYQSEETSRLPRLPRPKRLDETATLTTKPYRVRYFDIDNNGHVNNAHYFDWLLDSLPADFLRTHRPVDVQIRFENEVQYGHQVASQVVHADAATTQHRIMIGDTIAAIATVGWQSI
ncbi:acyl-[acyl-carrier-protein] thioesterase [Levilactobacillus zymae]|uniref:Acyl-ACP thioesterase n=1 Tax=Levilactobacillus zymae TaxID=267363 RepID=A0A1Y6JV57_9LACO|nr:acyl-ACP thioesterase domain-containing protein [Levilactobacillus zymae]KRL12149.1 acyl-ACP thioesterase [Levilactobacillus zymae DSM 19395]QFR61296.1 acyl-ACP thioesterase [Levilactobacillus zymae]GEO72492.1 acyl-ACP thioesterase [Levilactobacillus zymae]SMS13700.1 Acyl-ACP thioesterase [Levilactobacillus zymae]